MSFPYIISYVLSMHLVRHVQSDVCDVVHLIWCMCVHVCVCVCVCACMCVCVVGMLVLCVVLFCVVHISAVLL